MLLSPRFIVTVPQDVIYCGACVLQPVLRMNKLNIVTMNRTVDEVFGFRRQLCAHHYNGCKNGIVPDKIGRMATLS
jgi:hypothetical protein